MVKPESGATVQATVHQLIQDFQAAGLETPAVDARLLVAGAANLSREELMVQPNRMLPSTVLQSIKAFAERRIQFEPVSRILGRRGFYGRDFEISDATLDPRPETELIVDCVLQHVSDKVFTQQALSILDIGTGSGALLVTLLAELPHATGLGTDISGPALDVARQNAETHGVANRADFGVVDGAEGLTATFDILVCNPPYIPSGEIEDLMPDVRDYDPRLALDGGADGQSLYRRLASRVCELVPCGLAVFEVGAGQATEIAALMAAAETPQIAPTVTIIRDLGGHERCVAVLTHS